MNLNITNNLEEDPIWNTVFIERTGRENHLGGRLVNVYTSVTPMNTAEETENLVKGCVKAISVYLLYTKKCFSSEDTFQIVIGWAKTIRQTSRHITKTGGEWNAVKILSDEESCLKFYPGWTMGVFD